MDKSLVPEDDLPEAPSAAAAPAPVPAAGEAVPDNDLPEVPESDLPEAPSEVQPDQGTYGTGAQQAIAGLEGAAQGIAGPLATLAEKKLLGVKPEDIVGRQEANPWTHGVAEAGGFVGGLFTGVGEAALLGKIAESVSGAAKLSKVGSAAIKGAIEAGLFQTGDEWSKYLLNQSDPEAPVSAALAHIGGATLLGGAGGVLLGAAGNKLKEISEGKIASKFTQFMADLGNRFHILNNAEGPVAAATREAQHLHSTVSAAVDGGFSLKRDAVDKLTKEIDPAKTSAYVNGMIHTLENSPKELLADAGFQRELNAWKSAVTTERDIVGAPINPPSAADVFEATDSLKRKLQGFAKFEKRANDPNVSYFSKLAGDLSGHLRTSLENPEAWGEMGKFQKELNGAYSEMQVPLKAFESSAMSKNAELEKEVDPSKIASIFRSVEKGKPLAGFRDSKVSGFFDPARKFLQTVNDLHAAQGLESGLPAVSTSTLDEMLMKDVPRGAKFADWMHNVGVNSFSNKVASTVGGAQVGAHLGGIPGAVIGGVTGHVVPYLEEAIGKRVTKYAVPGILKALSAGSPEGVPQAMHYAEFIANGTKKIDDTVSNIFTVGGQKYLNHDFSEASREAMRKYVAEGQLNQQMQDQKNLDSGSGGKNMIAPAPAFAHGGEVLAPAPTPPVSKPVAPILAGTDHLSKVFPDQSMLLMAAKARMNNYLNQVRPQSVQAKLPFDSIRPDKKKEKSYNRALDIAAKPLSVLDHVKNGTLDPEHMQHMNALYPELTNHLRKKITQKVVEAQTKNEKPPYKVRQALSLFMGSPLDSSMTQQGIMAAQATFMQKGPQQPGQGGKKGDLKGLGDVSNQFRTADQAVQERQRRPK